jgi:predicted phosphodiesterase
MVRVFALSDVHCDYEMNADWIRNLSVHDFQDDILILAGDISDSMSRVACSLEQFVSRFHLVLFVPGNHELWTIRDGGQITSIEKFHSVCRLANDSGARTTPYSRPGLSIVPLFSWYDHSFGIPSKRLKDIWIDYHACKWEPGSSDEMITAYFLGLNEPWMDTTNDVVITFSHFLPRIDIMPSLVPDRQRILYPVLGSNRIDSQVRRLNANLHVYGHSHVNRQVRKSDVMYINNAFGYPHETGITSKSLLVIYEALG